MIAARLNRALWVLACLVVSLPRDAAAGPLGPWLPFGRDGVVSLCYDQACERLGFGLVTQGDRRLLLTAQEKVRALDLGSGQDDPQFRTPDLGALGAPADSIVVQLARFDDDSLLLAIQSSRNSGLLLRLGADGIPDGSFARPAGVYRALTVMPDGRFVGYRTDAGAAGQVWRFLPNGLPDGSFGAGGFVQDPVESGVQMQGLAVDAAGRTLIVGSVVASAAPDFAGRVAVVLRLRADGSRDTSFGSAGEVRLPFGGFGSDAVAALPEPDGALVVVANAAREAGTVGVAGLVRLDAQGRIDPTFGAGGTAWPGDAACSGVDFEAQSAIRLASGGVAIAAGGWKREGSSAPRTRFDFTGGGALLGTDARGAPDTGIGACGAYRAYDGSPYTRIARIVEWQGDLFATAVYVPPTFYQYFDYSAEVLRLSHSRANSAGQWQANVSEASDHFVLSVSRFGGDVGRVALHFATEDGSALAGRDYAATSGAFAWNDGARGYQSASIAKIAQACVPSGSPRLSFTLKFTSDAPGVAAPAAITVPLALPVCSGSASSSLPTVTAGPGGGGALDGSMLLCLAAGYAWRRRGVQRRSRSAGGSSTSG